MSLVPGSRLGAYEILVLLGAGGMGEVYKARDTRLNRSVAIKILPADLASDGDRRARFEREAHAIAALSHPHICVLHDVGRENGTDYLVMELLEGETLADRLARAGGRGLPLPDVLRYATEIADALDKAHRAGITHRDLKPANIMLTKSGTKLLDFGLAKLKKASAPLSMTTMGAATTHAPKTASGTILGTMHYMSPEQVEGREADARSDIWALGVVIYEMTTGARPFDGDSAASVIGAILKDTPPAMSAKQALSPPALDHVVEGCLEKDPDDRWQTLSDVKRELTWIARSASTAAASVPRSVSSKPSLFASAVYWAAIAVLGIAVAYQFTNRPSSPAPAVIKLDLNMPPGVEFGATNTPTISLSHDGTAVAFIGGVDGLRRVYLRRLDESVAKPLPGTETANVCFMSPDGRAIGFVSSGGVLKKVSIQDGLVTTLRADADANGGGASWGMDDRVVFVRSSELWDVAAGGGEPRQLTHLDKTKHEVLHAWPTVLPDSGVILFTVVTSEPRTRMHIEALTRATGERRSIVENASVPQYATRGYVLFFRDNSLVASSFDVKTLTVTGQATSVLENIAHDQLGMPMSTLSDSGVLAYAPSTATRHLVWVSRSGLERPIDDTPRPYQSPRLAPDGHRIVVELSGGDLWLEDTQRATFTRLTTGDTIGNTFAAWTPDGRRIIFRTVTGLWSLDPDGGGGLQPIADTSVNDVPSSVSPDGRTLAFIRQNTERAGDIYTLALDGPSTGRPLVTTSGYDGGAMFSPDGRWMTYVSNESGEFEVYVRPYPGPDRKFPVSTHGGTHPRWNPNGKELFYRSGNKMMAVDVTTRDGDIAFSQPHVLFEQRYAFGSGQTVPNYDVSPDGQRFVMVKDDSDAGRLNVVLNWFEELKTRVPLR